MFLDFLFPNSTKTENKKINKEKRIAILKEQYKNLKDFTEKVSYGDWEKSKGQTDLANSTCPKCNSKNVNDRIKRQQGSIKGSLEGGGGSDRWKTYWDESKLTELGLKRIEL